MKARDSEYTSVEAKKSMSSLARRSVKEEKGLGDDKCNLKSTEYLGRNSARAVE